MYDALDNLIETFEEELAARGDGELAVDPAAVAALPFELSHSFDRGPVEVTWLVFSMAESRWLVRYSYAKEDLICEWRMTLNFEEGILAPSFRVTVLITLPERLGQRYLFGLDISPGAKTFVEFYYERETGLVPLPRDAAYWTNFYPPHLYGEGARPIPLTDIPAPFKMVEVRHGAKVFDLRGSAKEGPGLMPSGVLFPFPMPDLIPWQHGYVFPVRVAGAVDDLYDFSLPVSLRMEQSGWHALRGVTKDDREGWVL